MVSRRDSPAMGTARDLGFRSVAAQELGFAAHPSPAPYDLERTAVKSSSRRTALTVMVSRRESPAKLATRDLRFRSVAAQELGSADICERLHPNTTCMKRKRAMKRSKGMGAGRHIARYKPTKEFPRSNERLFPGIPDDIAWDLIVPKLSWRAFPVLSSVSRAWREAIRSDRVYDEKVRANSTKTLLIHLKTHAIAALYSTSANYCYQLPPIPRFSEGKVHYSKWIAVGGKIYILGERELSDEGRVNACGNVYVLDLGRGQKMWEQCASMLQPRYLFGYGVLDDKIYVFGGRTAALKDGEDCPLSRGCEVYDTRENVWSPIMPMIPNIDSREVRRAAPVGKELYLLNCYESIVGVYNPAKDEWRVERLWERDSHWVVFVTEGKFYLFSESGIEVYDVEQKSWINRHTHSFAPFRPSDSMEFQPLHVSAVKDELFFIVDWWTARKNSSQSFHCKGFDGEKKELVWKKTNCSFETRHGVVVQVPIQL